MFNSVESNIIIDPYGSVELVFYPSNELIESSEISFSIAPLHHEYALKNLFYLVSKNDVLIGDLNQDGFLNVLDVISLVTIVIDGVGSSEYSDINNDNQTNILDIVSLVSRILDN